VSFTHGRAPGGAVLLSLTLSFPSLLDSGNSSRARPRSEKKAVNEPSWVGMATPRIMSFTFPEKDHRHDSTNHDDAAE
jgi:hypothetical protein